MSRSFPMHVGAGAFLLSFAITARADQFVLFDATFTYTWDDAMNAKPSKSHYYVNEGNWLNKARPANWISPVNYRDGKVHIRAEVLEKPAGDQTAGWALCYVANMGEYGCPYTNYYTKTGVYERDVEMRSFYNNATIQWEYGVKQVDLVYTINDSGSGHITNFPDRKDLVTPTKVRITMIQVSSGGTYDPAWIGKSDAGPGSDGGSIIDSGARDVTDAGARSDAGGTGGSGAGGNAGAGGTGTGATGGSAGTGGATGGAGSTGSGGATGGSATTGAGGTTGRGGSAGAAGSNGAGASSGVADSGHGSFDAAGASGTADPRGSRSSEPESMGCGCATDSDSRPHIAGQLTLTLPLFLLARRQRNRRRRSPA